MASTKSREEIIAAALRRHPHKKDHQIASILHRHGVHSGDIRAARAKAGAPVVKAAAKSGLSRNQFAAQFDVSVKCREGIRAGIKKIGPEELVPDGEFRSQRCGVLSANRWREVAAETEFEKYQVITGGNKIWWALPETVQWATDNVQGAHSV